MRWSVTHGSCARSCLQCDVVITDPPYDKRTIDGARSAPKLGETEARKTITTFGSADPREYLPRLLDAARRWVVAFCAIEDIGLMRDIAGDSWVRAGAWVKTNATPQFSGDRPATWGEGVAIMHRPGRKHWNGGGRPAIWHYPTIQGEKRYHETQKPLSLMLDLVKLFTDPGELAWDPFAGSGTTGVACVRLGREFVGHEIQEQYYQIATDRLVAEERGLELVDARRGQTSVIDLLGVDE